MGRIELRIPPNVEFLSLVRSVISSAASLDVALPDERIDDLRLAVSEATTNAIEAHHRRGTSEAIAITCDLHEDMVRVQVRDKGTGFDPDALVPHPPVTDPERLEFERGLGIPLMRKLADEHEIQPSPDGTAVLLAIYNSRRQG